MRLALCITDLDTGGAELCLVALATHIDRARFAPVVYCLGPRPDRPEASCVPRLEAAGIEVHCLGGRGARDAWRVVRDLAARLRKQRPHLVQTFLFHANIVGRLAARRAGVPRVLSGIRVAERRARWHLWLDRLTHRWVDRHVCVSQSVAQFAARHGLPADRLVVIPNGIDVNQYPAPRPADLAPLGIPPGSRVVTFVGRLDRQKGLDWLLAGAPLWIDRVPGCHLLLVGDGPELRPLERLRERFGLTSRVHFALWRPDVAELLAASDLLVLPSRWEGMPNVVLQAMASRLPVVATEVEGVRELLGESADVQVVPFGDSPRLAERLVHLLSHPESAAALGQENRRRAEQQFSLQQMVSAYEGLWQDLAGAIDEPHHEGNA
jgi:glycosyltransferase involved in cell wall biosynthesis